MKKKTTTKKVTTRAATKKLSQVQPSILETRVPPIGPVPDNVFASKIVDDPFKIAAPSLHKYGKGKNERLCATDTLGHATPEGKSPLELVVDATDGFIPLWAKGMDLRWRFNEASFNHFQNPAAAKARIRELFARAVLAWGGAAPVQFKEKKEAWDFEITVHETENCNINGCTLARAFFPDGGRHDLMIYPTLFSQDPTEQVETLIHEIGHIFGLRHFFAPVSETEWSSEIFGTHHKFSIMNYGADSKLTEADKADLASLYNKAWSKELTAINGTPIRLVTPFHKV